MLHLELVALGFLVGVLVSITGIAGGSIVTPLLIAFNVPPLTAVSTDLLYSAPTNVFAAFLQHRQRNVDWRVVRMLLLGAVPAVIAGTLLLAWLRWHVGLGMLQLLTRRSVGAAVVLAALIIILRPWLVRTLEPPFEEHAAPGTIRLWLPLVGFFVGSVFALTSVGSGSLMLPALAIMLPAYGMRAIVGSNLAFAATLIVIASVARTPLWHADVPAAASLIIGSVPGVFVGSKISKLLSQQYLRPVVAVMLVIAGLRTLLG